MVFVIVEIDQEDIGQLGTRHKITVVEELQTACGCSKPVSKRQKIESASTSNIMRGPTLNANIFHDQEITEFKSEQADTLLPVDGGINVVDLLMNRTEPNISDENLDIPRTKCGSSPPPRRNNGVPYNSGLLYPPLKKSEEEENDQSKEDYVEGIDLAIKCMLCSRIIALGSRPANHSTRKYAHARCHGFKNRFECNLCQAVFKNKRVTLNHNKSVHNNDPSFKVVDTWNEACQRELMLMVRKCFPRSNKPFLRNLGEVIEEEGDDTIEDLRDE